MDNNNIDEDNLEITLIEPTRSYCIFFLHYTYFNSEYGDTLILSSPGTVFSKKISNSIPDFSKMSKFEHNRNTLILAASFEEEPTEEDRFKIQMYKKGVQKPFVILLRKDEELNRYQLVIDNENERIFLEKISTIKTD